MKGFDVATMGTYHELPITSFSGWDRVWQIEAILAEHDRGLFRDSATLCDSMMRDDRISAVSDTRVSALLASPVECKPANPRSKASRAAKEIGGGGEFPGLYSRIFPSSAVAELVWWGNWVGFGIAQIIWDTSGTGNFPSTAWTALNPGSWWSAAPGGQGQRPLAPDAYLPLRYKVKAGARWTPRLKVFHPQYVYWDWSLARLVAMCLEGPVILPNPDEQLHGDGKWFIWAPRGYQYGWLKAMVRRLAHKYIMRGWDYRDWARYNERHGMPIVGAIVPAGSNDQVKDRFKADLSSMNSDAVVPLPQGSDPKSNFDLKIIEPVARTYQSFQLFKRELDDDIAITMLGQNLTTQAGGAGASGSKAAGEVQNQVRIDKRKEDAHIATAFRDQVLWWDAGYNYDDPEVAPIVEYQVAPPEDEGEESRALLSLGQAISALNTAAPGMINVRAMLDDAGVALLSEEEVAAAKEEKLQDEAHRQEVFGAPAVPGAPGVPGKALPPKKATTLSALPSAIAKYVDFQGLHVAVESPAGSDRHWTAKLPDGSEKMGVTRMTHDYGFIVGHVGNDKDELDVYVGPDETARYAYVVHQLHPDGTFDEDKVMLGFPSADAAKAAFLAHRDDGESAYGGINEQSMDDFKARLRRRRGTGMIRASAAPAIEQVVNLLTGVVVRRAERARVALTAADKRRARYADRVEQAGARRAAEILRRDVDKIVEALNAAKDLKDFQDRVVTTYRHQMRPDELAALVKKTNLMAHMAGRFTAAQAAEGKGA